MWIEKKKQREKNPANRKSATDGYFPLVQIKFIDLACAWLIFSLSSFQLNV